MVNQTSRGRLTRTRLFSLLAALAAVLSVSAVASGTAAAATGSYTLTITQFFTPSLYNEDEFIDAQAFSPPAGVPSTATVTSVSIAVDWLPKPNPPGYYSSSTNYSLWLCTGTVDLVCGDLSPTVNGASGWTASTDLALYNLNASTQTFHVAAGLFDSAGTGGSIKKAINPVVVVNTSACVGVSPRLIPSSMT